jgi:hypothetical protein
VATQFHEEIGSNDPLVLNEKGNVNLILSSFFFNVILHFT